MPCCLRLRLDDPSSIFIQESDFNEGTLQSLSIVCRFDGNFCEDIA
jgi:hypothetical protein